MDVFLLLKYILELFGYIVFLEIFKSQVAQKTHYALFRNLDVELERQPVLRAFLKGSKVH